MDQTKIKIILTLKTDITGDKNKGAILSNMAPLFSQTYSKEQLKSNSFSIDGTFTLIQHRFSKKNTTSEYISKLFRK